MKIYTKTGDKGISSLFGGKKVLKNDIRLEAYGSIDELIAFIGLLSDQQVNKIPKEFLFSVQERLMLCAANIAAAGVKIHKKLPLLSENDIQNLEKEIDLIDAQLEPIKHFIIPGGHPALSLCHIARTVCRRAERNCVSVMNKYPFDTKIIQYLNRLSDYLFVLTRWLAKVINIPEKPWLII